MKTSGLLWLGVAGFLGYAFWQNMRADESGALADRAREKERLHRLASEAYARGDIATGDRLAAEAEAL